MEFKERYELIKEINQCSIDCYLKDNTTSMLQPIEITRLINLLNQQSKQIEELKNKLAKQSEWIENNKNKAKNCAIQMNNQAKEITRLKQSNKDLMRVIWNTKRERAKKGREICKANNYMIAKDKQIAELQQQLKSQPAEICQELIDMLTDRAELIEAGLCAEFMFTVYDLRKSVEEILKEYQK